jgi:hypothetical protein
MSEETIVVKYKGDYPGTIDTKSYVPGKLYKVSKDRASYLLRTGQFTKMKHAEVKTP